ncbi:hypothetical protein C8Q74DRAFT_364798 [Fomes fomentarius]|nr:hypothetical protein C8Q74DRAFT_364798 [Fomes fomentarius]
MRGFQAQASSRTRCNLSRVQSLSFHFSCLQIGSPSTPAAVIVPIIHHSIIAEFLTHLLSSWSGRMPKKLTISSLFEVCTRLVTLTMIPMLSPQPPMIEILDNSWRSIGISKSTSLMALRLTLLSAISHTYEMRECFAACLSIIHDSPRQMERIHLEFMMSSVLRALDWTTLGANSIHSKVKLILEYRSEDGQSHATASEFGVS